MNDRTPMRAIARARLLAELEQALRHARDEARTLAEDPGCTLEVGLLVTQLDRIAAEVEQIRQGRIGRDAGAANSNRRPLPWHGPFP